MTFPDDLGTIACRCVIEGTKPVLFVSHAGGDWQMYCHYSNHDFNDEQAMSNDLRVVHVAHLVARDPTFSKWQTFPSTWERSDLLLDQRGSALRIRMKTKFHRH